MPPKSGSKGPNQGSDSPDDWGSSVTEHGSFADPTILNGEVDTLNGEIEQTGDGDWFKFLFFSSYDYEFVVDVGYGRKNSRLDPIIQLFDSGGILVQGVAIVQKTSDTTYSLTFSEALENDKGYFVSISGSDGSSTGKYTISMSSVLSTPPPGNDTGTDPLSGGNPDDDPYFSNQWGMHNTGQPYAYYSNGRAVSGTNDADTDWYEAYTFYGSPNRIKVGIIDSGIDLDHEDLFENIKGGYDFVDGDDSPNDVQGHGTHVAGIVGALDNQTGVIGYNPRSDLYAYKAGGSDGTLSSQAIIASINKAIEDGVRVVNASYGRYSNTIDTAMLSAYSQLQAKDIILVAAAGNSGWRLPYTGLVNGFYYENLSHFPSGYQLDNIISVASTNADDQLSSFSNYGSDEVDVAAPGEIILSTTFDGNYGFKSGTSMAAPAVTGLVSLIWSNNPNLTYKDVVNAVMSTVDPVTGLDVSSGGRINVQRALEQIEVGASTSSMASSNSEVEGSSSQTTTLQQDGLIASPLGTTLSEDEISDNTLFVATLNRGLGLANALSKLKAKITNAEGLFSMLTSLTEYENLPGIVSFESSDRLSKSAKIDLASKLTDLTVFEHVEPDLLYYTDYSANAIVNI